MNDEMLRRLADEIAKQTVLDSWPFYVLLIILSFVGATIGPFLKARFTRRGEISATKADADEILRQLQRTTEAAKSVELSLARGDWIQREKNVLKRAKLERLVIAAFALSTWARTETQVTIRLEESKPPEAFDEFEMLSELYFPELEARAKKLRLAYGRAVIFLASLRSGLLDYKESFESAVNEQNFEKANQVRVQRKKFMDENTTIMVTNINELYNAAHELGAAARKLMEELITSSPD